jgi:prolyl-tRNA synthetase
MQDRKALQAGTSHFLGQNFSKAQEIRFQDEAGKLEHAWTTSWGVSTRLIGALIMTHSDDDGLVLPPKLAPSHIVILPITAKAENPGEVLAYCKKLRDDLQNKVYAGRAIEVVLDERDIRGGDKIWGWVKKGIPIRVEVGPRDMAGGTVFVGRRDGTEKQSLSRDAFVDGAVAMLDDIQNNILARAKATLAEHTRKIDSKDDLYAFFTPKNAEEPEIHGGFALMHWSGEREVEEKLKAELNITLRCIPLEDGDGPGVCPMTGKPSKQRVIWAKAY